MIAEIGDSARERIGYVQFGSKSAVLFLIFLLKLNNFYF
jgi:hypothetical protein